MRSHLRIETLRSLLQDGVGELAEVDQRPAQAQLDAAVSATELARQLLGQRRLLVLRNEDDGGAPGGPRDPVVGIAEHLAGDPGPGALVADLGECVQGLTAGLVAPGVELPVETWQNDLRRHAGERPGEHVPNEEVRLDRAPLDEQLRVVGVGSGADGQGRLQTDRRALSAQGIRDTGVLRGCTGHRDHLLPQGKALSRCQGQVVPAADAHLDGDQVSGRSRSTLASIIRRACRLKPGSGLTSRWMASPSTSPCSAVVSASTSRSGHDLLTDFAWHSGLFAAAAATTWVARSGLLRMVRTCS